jgi:hypothetical protein
VNSKFNYHLFYINLEDPHCIGRITSLLNYEIHLSTENTLYVVFSYLSSGNENKKKNKKKKKKKKNEKNTLTKYMSDKFFFPFTQYTPVVRCI